MLTATRHTRIIYAAFSLAREMFTDILPSGDDWTDGVATLQKEFKTLRLLESRCYEILRADLNDWRNRVKCGDVDFDSAREDDFKGALRALIMLESLLVEKFDAYVCKGLFLANTRLVGFVKSHLQEAKRILDSWKSPEWETTNERTVKLDKEQTRRLREKLNSCKS